VLTPAAPLDVQFASLSGLADGWLDGAGKAVTAEVLSKSHHYLNILAALGLPTPHLYPTEEGYVRGEWSTPTRCEVSIECSEDRVYFHNLNLTTDEWEEADVNYLDACLSVVESLRRLLVS